ncbi:hypothetical protein BCR33DRAFT_768251 [Rhizoclosmatium globosum]|uniref:Uncharacterized protein n=1 Tax=Rhizoclosmatium globosum TaxID=329046 RepID=A0A1Y2BYG8_9FUNG|nr:hypothetical protein BCR33DRAFT_768251 [Rhizoclosmatium globosum]|eukprot:ORY39822.1 hypothetical protein BCR33DRAFT_768251 [Rhizoclosmatium globosum]
MTGKSSTIPFTTSTISSPVPSSTSASTCATQSPSPIFSAIADGPIPSITPMQKYSGEATEIIATLNTLVLGSLNQLNANQVSSSLFQITEPIHPGDAPVTFLGAAFGSGSNAVVVLITSTQYKFTGLPSAQDIQVYNDVTCSIAIKTVSFSNEGGVGFSYVLDGSYKNEWFAMQLDSAGKKLIVSVYSEHAAVASIVFGVEVIGGKRAVDDVGFVVVNGVGVVNKRASVATETSVSNGITSSYATSPNQVPSSFSVTTGLGTSTVSSVLTTEYSVIMDSSLVSVASTATIAKTPLSTYSELKTVSANNLAIKTVTSAAPTTASVLEQRVDSTTLSKTQVSTRFNVVIGGARSTLISAIVVVAAAVLL